MLALLSALAPRNALATVYFVSATTGDDAAPGTYEKPFRTLQRAANIVNPGDVVKVLPGVYAAVTTKRHGNASARIQFVSTTKWGAVIRTSGIQYIWTNSANYIDIENFEMTGDARIGILNYASYTNVLGNHIHHLGRADCSDWGAGDMGAAIDHIGAPTTPRTATNNQTIGNVVHDGSLHCPAVAGISGQHGLYHAYGSGVIANNIVYRMQSYGIHLWHLPKDLRVIHNLSFKNGASGIVVGGQANNGTADDIYVANNIFFDNARFGARLMGLFGSNIRYVNNLVFQNPAGPFDANASTRASGTVSSDPLFVDYRPGGDGNYRLSAGSPAIDRGVGLSDSEAQRDFDGTTRPFGNGFDIGPFEWGPRPVQRPAAPARLLVR